MPIARYIIYFGHLLLLLNTILLIRSYRKQSVAFNIYTYYLILILIIQIISSYKSFYKTPNIHLSHFYFIGQFILLSIFFKNILEKKSLKKITTFTLVIVVIAMGLYYVLYPSNYYKFNIFEIVITSVPLITYCFFFFIQAIDGTSKKFTYIVSGFFLYILCSTLLFISGNLNASIMKAMWAINALLYIIYQVLIFTEWYKNLRTLKKDHSQLND